MSSVRICGPKLSIFGLVLSLWGVVQLSIMAVSLYYNSVTFVEDLRLDGTYDDAEALRKDMEVHYGQAAENCGIAALLYLVTLTVSLHQFWLNHPDAFSWPALVSRRQRGYGRQLDISMSER